MNSVSKVLIAFKNIVMEQIIDIRQKDKVSLSDMSVTIKESDAPLIKSLKKTLSERIKKREESLGEMAVDLMEACIDKENMLLKQIRFHNKEAKRLTKEAADLYNGRHFLLENCDSMPLALALGLVPLSDLKIVHKHVESLNVPNYLKQHKHSVESSKTE